MPDQLLTLRQTAALLNLREQTIYGWRRLGVGPPAYKIGGQVRYDRGELLAWLEAQRDEPRRTV